MSDISELIGSSLYRNGRWKLIGLIFVGGENEGPWFIPDILVNVHRAGEESIGVIREALPVW